MDILSKQVLRSPLDVVICEGRHSEVAVVIIGLIANIDTLLVADFLCSLIEILRQKLLLLVEIVASALKSRSISLAFNDLSLQF